MLKVMMCFHREYSLPQTVAFRLVVKLFAPAKNYRRKTAISDNRSHRLLLGYFLDGRIYQYRHQSVELLIVSVLSFNASASRAINRNEFQSSLLR